MKNFFQTIKNLGNRVVVQMTPIHVLIVGNMLAVSALIALSNFGVLPLRLWDFVFFSLLFFLIALYRSGWIFSLLVGMLPLEIVNIAPVEFGINLRPYQMLAVVLFGALCVRLMTKKIRWTLFEWHFLDVVMAAFLFSGLVLIPFLPFPELASAALKQSFILLSFGLLYVLGRIFLKRASDIRIAISFFLSSVFVVLSYALWQSIRFKAHLPSFEVMAGRPNGTFPEADFLGGFLAMVIAGMAPFGLRFFFQDGASLLRRVSFFVFFFLLSLILVLTVARSGWFAAAMGIVIASTVFFWKRDIFGALRYRDTDKLLRAARGKAYIGASILAAILTVVFCELTTFDLFDRGSSFSSGLQKITISCDQDSTLPVRLEKIGSMEQLALWHCRHIDLEAIESERSSGHFIAEVFRDDPNISVRKNTYAASWTLIMSHPLTGIGWGNDSHFFGVDGRGAGMNASNVFLEIWLGVGVFGFLLFMVFWLSLPILIFTRDGDDEESIIGVGFFAIWLTVTAFNCFNSGLLLGSLWMLFAIFVWFVNKRVS